MGHECKRETGKNQLEQVIGGEKDWRTLCILIYQIPFEKEGEERNLKAYNRGGELFQSTLYASMELSQWEMPLYY
jgi:hypothetical protein